MNDRTTLWLICVLAWAPIIAMQNNANEMDIEIMIKPYDGIFNLAQEQQKLQLLFEMTQHPAYQQETVAQQIAVASMITQQISGTRYTLPDSTDMQQAKSAAYLEKRKLCRHGCLAYFANRSSRLRHEKAKHPETFPYKCSHCALPFKRKCYKIRHELAEHSNNSLFHVIGSVPQS